MKKTFVYTTIVALLFSYTGSAYLGNYSRLIQLVSSNYAELIMMRIGYFLQALGMLLYSFILSKKSKTIPFINSAYANIIVISLSVIPMCFMQLSTNVTVITIASFIFNVITGMIFQLYLIQLAYNVRSNSLGLCFGIAYALGSIFTFLITYFDGGVFMESPSMVFIYIVMATLSSIMLLNSKSIKEKSSLPLNKKEKKYIILLSVCIILATIVVALGDGIYNFGRWSSEADIRVVRSFYAFGLILSGFIYDKNRRLGVILTVAFLSYFIISAFLLNNAISSSVMMSLGYFFMSFLAQYRYLSMADITYDHPKYLPWIGFGLMISRIVEGLTALLMMAFPLSLTMHVVVTLLFYSPLVILAIISDNIKYSSSDQTEAQQIAKFCEKYSLTSREQEICELLIQNASDDEISSKLFISKPTVRFHISNILKKTKTKSRVGIRRLFER